MLVITLLAIVVYGVCSFWIFALSAAELQESGTGSRLQLLGLILSALFWPVTVPYMSLVAATSKWRLNHVNVRHATTLKSPRHSA